MTEQLSPIGRFQRVLVAGDGSEFSAGAVREAIGIAHKCGARLYALTVVQTNPEYEALAPKLVEQADADARATLAKIQADAGARGVTCETMARHGAQIYAEVVAVADELDVDLIVVGRRGKSGLMRLLMGSTAKKIIGFARRPVMVVPRTADILGKDLLLATDGSRYSDAAAVTAAALGKLCDTTVTVLSVEDGKPVVNAQAVVDRTTALMAAEGARVQGEVGAGRPDEVIVKAAEAHKVGLIVLGSHGHTGLERLLVGSVSERVIGHAQGAVLVV
ncbi:MAG: universal stress protein [Thiohalomonadaceae bacterium]